MHKATISIPDVIERFARYYAANPSWGTLHIVVEEGNVTDDNVKFAKEWAVEANDVEGMALAEILMGMSKSQRGRVHRKASEWLRSQDPPITPDPSLNAFRNEPGFLVF